MIARVLLLVLLALGGCKKKAKYDSGPAPTPDAAPAPAPAPVTLTPLPASSSGPAYVLTEKVLARYDAEGWTKTELADTMLVLLFGRDVVVVGAAVKRLVDGKLVDVPVLHMPSAIAVGADGVIWAIIDAKVVRAPGEVFELVDFASDDPPRGIAVTRDGTWVTTLDRTYMRTGTTWKSVDVPNVTGQVADIVQIAAHPKGELYLATTIGLLRRTADTWVAVNTGQERNIAAVIPGPADRFAIVTRTDEVLLGDTRGMRPLEVSNNERPRRIDAAGRLWSLTPDEIRVRDWDGKLVRQWRAAETTAGSSGRLLDVLVVDGGPPVKLGERMHAKVTGKIEGSAAGIQVIACSSAATPTYGEEPCAKVENTRKTVTVAGGRFVLDDMPIAPMHFWVNRSYWRQSENAPCCDQLRPDQTFDIGTLRLR